MAEKQTLIPISTFKTPEGEARFLSAYARVLARWPVPYEEIQVNTRFGLTHVIASGDPAAPALVLVHAFFATAVTWQPNVAALSRRYRVYAVDCLGEPNPGCPTRPISSREEFSQWWVDLFDGLRIERADMVGNSNGGFLSLNQALYTPGRVGKVALIAPAATFIQMWPFYFNFFLPVMLGSRPLIERAFRWCGQGLAMDAEWEEVFRISLLDGISINRVFPAVFKDEELAQIHTPTLLLIGDREVIYDPRKAIARAERLMPNLCAEIIPDANHIAGISNPGWINRRLLQFLAEGG